MIKRFVGFILVALIASALLAACGGGSSGGTSHEPFRLVKVETPDSTTVVLTFNNDVDETSVTSITQFSVVDRYVNPLGPTAIVSVVANTITLDTYSLTPCETLTVTVDQTVMDKYSQSLELTDDSMDFEPTGDGGSIVINEVDYDQPGTDYNEFIELYNPGSSPVGLANKVLMLFNGASNTLYQSIDLSVHDQLCPGRYLVINSGTVTVPDTALTIGFSLDSNNVQNGAPDGMAIVNMIDNSVLDTLSYEGDMTAAQLPGGGTINLVEGTATAEFDSISVEGSLARCPNGTDTDNASSDWKFVDTLTPGSGNKCVPGKAMFMTSGIYNGNLVAEEGSGLGNGIAAADALCMTDGNYPGYGIFNALIVDGTNRVASVIANAGDGQVDWVLTPSTDYYRAEDSAFIMQTDANGIFVFGTLANSISTATELYWTGLDKDWTTQPDTSVSQTCNGWTYGGSPGPYGTFAYTDATDWGAIYWSYNAFCYNEFHLVCVEQ